MSVPQAPRGSPSEQIAAILQLAEALYEATGREPTLIDQARNELSLLRSVVNATRISLTLLCGDFTVVALSQVLDGCRAALEELEELRRQADEVGPVNPLSDIRGRFSSLIFELSVINADILMYVDLGPVSKIIAQALTYFVVPHKPMSTVCCRVTLKMFERGSESLELSQVFSMMLLQRARKMKHGTNYKLNCTMLVSYLSGRTRTMAISYQHYDML